MLEREDVFGTHFKATMKPMPNGETRLRLKPGPALKMATKALHVTKSPEFDWQGQFHRHLRQVERYLVISGTLATVSWAGGDAPVQGNIYSPNMWFSFEPGVWHDVLTTSGAEFVTVQVAASEVDVETDREVMKDLPLHVKMEMLQISRGLATLRNR